MQFLNSVEEVIKAVLTSPLIFLVIIAISIVWQQQNSKRLATESGQESLQSTVFSWIMSVAIFISVINDLTAVAYIGVIVEMIINVFLVLSDRRKVIAEITAIDNKLQLLQGLQKKGLEIVALKNERVELEDKTNGLGLSIRIFIAALMPLSLLVLSHLYIS